MKQILLSLMTAGIALSVLAQTSYTPPVTLTIDSQEAFDQWTVINTNDDNAFEYTSDGATLADERYSADNDWLISPTILFEGGASYNII